MITTGRFSPRRGLLLAVLVGGLLAGLIGMHHLAAAGGPSGGGTAVVVADGHGVAPESGRHRSDSSDDRPHDAGIALLHLCLAVLASVAITVAALVLWWHPVPAPPPATDGVRQVVTRPRGPPRGAPARLALLCVLRT